MRISKPWFREQTKTWYVWIDGKQHNLGKNKTKAHEKYRELMAVKRPSSESTVREVIDAYWNWLKKNRANETVSSRDRLLKSFGESVPKNLKANKIRPLHVQAWIDANSKVKVAHKIRSGPEKGKTKVKATERDISPTTANTRIALIIAVFSWAKSMGYVTENPLEDMPKPTRKTRQEFVPADLWPQVLALATDECFRDWLTVVLATGCRVQDMFKFEPEHYDPVGRRLVLPIEDSKGQRISNVIYLPNEVVPIVERLVHECPEGSKLFLNSKGKPFNRNSIRCRFKRLKRKLGLPWLTATHLRHSYAHHRLTSGQDSLTVSKLLNHVDTRMLATRYGHLHQNPEFMSNAANQIDFPTLPCIVPNPNGQLESSGPLADA